MVRPVANALHSTGLQRCGILAARPSTCSSRNAFAKAYGTQSRLLTCQHTRQTVRSARDLQRQRFPGAACFSTTSFRSEGTDEAASRSTSSRAKAPQLTWNDFLRMRRTRRYVNLGTSVGTALAGVAAVWPLVTEYEVDTQISSMTGLDPFIALGLTITAVGGVGWLMGPSVGNAGFMLRNRSIRGAIAQKERDFYDHIKRFRADPTSSSVNNPVPDYYGEKIGSVADYRRWLKDQRAFNRKKNKNLL